jgi:PadR family transcriptional regulator PadR
MKASEIDVMQGTLDLLVLKALTGGPMHGYNVLAWLRDTTEGALRVEDAALYPALHRMESRGLIESEWGLSENNRRAKFYRLTAGGRDELGREAEDWRRYVEMVGKVLSAAPEPSWRSA